MDAPGAPGDPFKDHLFAVLRLHDVPVPVPQYSGPRDWQTDVILREVEALMRRNDIASISNGHRARTYDSEASVMGHYTDGCSDTTPSIDGSSSYTDSEPDYTTGGNGPLICPACGHR
ncbi:hypothetical protein GGX14DRAFT_39906, partial [Mycena pura]